MESAAGPDGVTYTLDTLGAELPMSTLVFCAGPSTIPSFGVTVQVTVSPPSKPVLTVLLLPITVVPLVHSTLELSFCPSISVKV